MDADNHIYFLSIIAACTPTNTYFIPGHTLSRNRSAKLVDVTTRDLKTIKSTKLVDVSLPNKNGRTIYCSWI